MMDDVVLQVLLILAYLAIGLMAITFPIYAICVTFLPQERWESEKERKKRIEKLGKKISELTAELKGEKLDRERVTQLKDQLGRYESELKGTELRVDCLTAKGAVGTPVAYLALALLTVGVGIYYFSLETLEGVAVFGFISSLCSALAVRRLYKTISAIEYSALRPARTIGFEVCFERMGVARQTEEMKLGRKSMLTVYASTTESDIESFWLFMRFPSEFEILDVGDASMTQLPKCCWVFTQDDFLPRNLASGIIIEIKPNKVGEYPITVRIFGKGIYEVEKELTVKVVE